MTDVSLETMLALLNREKPHLAEEPALLVDFSVSVPEEGGNGRVHMAVHVGKGRVFDIYAQEADISITWRDDE